MAKRKAKPANITVVWKGPSSQYIHGIPGDYFSGEPITLAEDVGKKLVDMTRTGAGRFETITEE